MKKVLIFENEYSFVSTPFEYVKDIYFDNQVEYTVHSNSQELRPFTKVSDFDFIFVDISLGRNSELDGIGILKKMEQEGLIPDTSRIVILTGNHSIETILRERGVQRKYRILTKPIDFNDVLNILNDDQ